MGIIGTKILLSIPSNNFEFKLLLYSLSSPKTELKIVSLVREDLFRRQGLRCPLCFQVVYFLVVSFTSTTTTSNASVGPNYLAPVVYSLTANVTDHTRSRAARKIHLAQLN